MLAAAPLAHAWNAAGHRLVAAIAWQQLSPSTRLWIADALSRHPDHPRWLAKARPGSDLDIFAEASTWPDSIRNDPRFYDAGREPATPPLPGLTDTARHKNWHYTDRDERGQTRAGELEQQVERHAQVLRSTDEPTAITYSLPWLLHLVGNIHQPLHVGQHGDEGGNAVEIENPFNRRQTFSSLHSYWDDLPGPSGLRGKRLETQAAELMREYAPAAQGLPRQWADESHRLLASAYPDIKGSLLPLITADFHQRAGEIAKRRLAEAGYRLGRLLERSLRERVSHETPTTSMR